MDYGTDIRSDWSFNEEGDLNLISNVDNIVQAITNRLTCDLESMALFYKNYGCVVRPFFSWHKSEEALEFIRIELENRIQLEQRIEGYTISVSYLEDKGVKVEIYLQLNETYTHKIELILGDDSGD